MELFNNENPFYERWKVGRPSFKALEKRASYWKYESENQEIKTSIKCFNYKANLKPQKCQQ